MQLVQPDRVLLCLVAYAVVPWSVVAFNGRTSSSPLEDDSSYLGYPSISPYGQPLKQSYDAKPDSLFLADTSPQAWPYVPLKGATGAAPDMVVPSSNDGLPTGAVGQLSEEDVQIITRMANEEKNPHRTAFQTMKQWIVNYRSFSAKARNKLAQGIYAAACFAAQSRINENTKDIIVIDNIVIRGVPLPATTNPGVQIVQTDTNALSDVNVKVLAKAFLNLAQLGANLQAGGTVRVDVDRFTNGFAVYSADSPQARALNRQIDSAVTQRAVYTPSRFTRRSSESFADLVHKAGGAATQLFQGLGHSQVEKIVTLQCKAGNSYEMYQMNSGYQSGQRAVSYFK